MKFVGPPINLTIIGKLATIGKLASLASGAVCVCRPKNEDSPVERHAVRLLPPVRRPAKAATSVLLLLVVLLGMVLMEWRRAAPEARAVEPFVKRAPVRRPVESRPVKSPARPSEAAGRAAEGPWPSKSVVGPLKPVPGTAPAAGASLRAEPVVFGRETAPHRTKAAAALLWVVLLRPLRPAEQSGKAQVTQWVPALPHTSSKCRLNKWKAAHQQKGS